MKKNFYITTPIYYPSAHPHLGHAYCTTLTDIIARNKRMRGADVFFLTGLDEHGEKIQKNAEAKGVSPQEFVDEVAVTFKELWNKLRISNNDFIRTTEKRHLSTVQDIFSKFVKDEDVYLSAYKGWYCVHEESYWTETQLGPDHTCPECGRPVEEKKEEAYFFSCKKYLDDLLKLYEENPKIIVPVGRKTEMINNFIKPGLNDLCITRTSFSWGVPIKEKEGHVIYVWLDALTNYISALGYGKEDHSLFDKFWGEDSEIVHIIGADITRFHTIYWPMFLKALNLREPDEVFVHGLLMMKDGKMSKSKGNVVYVEPLIERYGVDAVRYFLGREIVFGQDGEFTPEGFVERINGDLANDFGNLLNRTLGMIGKYFDGVIPSRNEADFTDLDRDLLEKGRVAAHSYEVLFDDLKVTESLAKAMELADEANKYIQERAPWALAKDESKKNELANVMNILASILFEVGMLLSPALVEKSEGLFDQLGLDKEDRTYEKAVSLASLEGIKTQKGEPLFPRLDIVKETEAIKEMMAGPKEKAAA